LPTRAETQVSVQEEPNITQTMQAIRMPDKPKIVRADDRNKNDIWWLIGAAALIGLGLAVLLFVKF
jgi:hypothetical protein